MNRRVNCGPTIDSVHSGGGESCKNLGIPSLSAIPCVDSGTIPCEDKDDRMIRPEVGALIQGLVPDKFTLEGCCNTMRTNRVFDCESCTPLESFLNKDVGGHHVYLNPPYSDPTPFVKHYMACKRAKPYTTSCVLVLPDWSGFKDLVKGWKCIQVFKEGSYLFKRPGKDGKYHNMKSTRWPVKVYYDMPGTPLRLSQQQALNHRGPTFMFKGKITQLPVEVGIAHKVLLDSGASCNFVSLRFLERSGLLHKLKPSMDVVTLADESPLKVHGQLKLPLSMGKYTGIVPCLAAEIEQDVILGDLWLAANRAYMDYGTKTCVLRKGNKRIVLKPPTLALNNIDVVPYEAQTPCSDKVGRKILTAVSTMRSLKKSGTLWGWILVSKEGKVQTLAGFGSKKADLDTYLDTLEDDRLAKLLSRFKKPLGPIPKEIPKDRGVSHVIPLEQGATPPFRHMLRLTKEEREELETMIAELLERGWIEPSTSPYGAPILFVRKKTGELRLCIDYRALNKITVKNRYPLPRIDDLLDSLGGARYFSSLDLASGYHQIKISPEDVPKTAFRTPMGHYQWRVLSMGLTNAPSTFQQLMNQYFAHVIGKFVVIYIDDILIYSRSKEEHYQHIEQVLEILDREDLYCKISKCEFFKEKINFVGHVVSKDGIYADPTKLAVVAKWKSPKDPQELRSFLGFANYFRRFVLGYSSITASLTELLKLKKWDSTTWKDAHQRDFDRLKVALTSTPVLGHFDPNKPLELICDASKVALGAVLMQDGHPIAYESRKLNPAETRYSTGDRELLAVIHCLKVWRCYLEGTLFTLVTDHQPNTHLRSIETWTDRHARWSERLERFSYRWEYREGRLNVADPLSRLPYELNVVTRGQRDPSRRVNYAPSGHKRVRLDPTPSSEELPPGDCDGDLEDPTTRGDSEVVVEEEFDPPMIPSKWGGRDPNDALCEDPTHEGRSFLTRDEIVASYGGEEWLKELAQHKYTLKPTGLYYHEDKVVIPSGPSAKALRDKVIREHHDTYFAGHIGFESTKASIRRGFFWQRLSRDVADYCSKCLGCQKHKGSRTKPYGPLKPIDPPKGVWEAITMDFITDLPLSQGYDGIAVFVDRLSKMVHLSPVNLTGLTALELSKVFMREIFRHHGVPKRIVSDRDVRMTSTFWKQVVESLGSKCDFSTAFHPRTDGLTERTNRTIEEIVRQFISPTMLNWPDLLPCVEFALNDRVHEVTKMTPFFMMYGYHPSKPVDIATSRDLEGKKTSDEIQAAWKRARELIEEASRKAKARFDSHVKEIPFVEGDLVWLSSRNFKWRYGTKKFCPKWLGPFKIIGAIGEVSFKLKLPSEWKVHNVFHASLLKPFVPGTRYKAPEPSSMDEDGVPVWDLECVLKHKDSTSGGTRSYLVAWSNFGPEYASWLSEGALADARELIQDYWARVEPHPMLGQAEACVDMEE